MAAGVHDSEVEGVVVVVSVVVLVVEFVVTPHIGFVGLGHRVVMPS